MRLMFVPFFVMLCVKCALAINWPITACGSENDHKKIVLIAGTVDRGHLKGTHEYQKTVLLLAQQLRPIGDATGFDVEVHFDGWPDQPATLDNADTIVLVSNGGDRRETDHPFLVGDRRQIIERQMQRGCGLVLVHWSIFWPEEHRDKILGWTGGYFDYQSGAAQNGWFSRIKTLETQQSVVDDHHPITRRVKDFSCREELYYRIQFPDDQSNVIPILHARIEGEEHPQVVAWAFERPDGGRGFAYTGGHFFENWQNPSQLRMLCNAVLWSANISVPPRGVVLAPHRQSRSIDVLNPDKINVALVTGRQHPAHDWRSTTEVLTSSITVDERVAVDVIQDVEFLGDPALQDYDVVLLNYCNWQSPGLSERAKQNFVTFLQRGGGLVLIHFANGAFHYSLPGGEESDWPEYRNICRRVWDHQPGQSGHDAYGTFRVDIRHDSHPIMRGIESFETIDELYYRQQGDAAIELLCSAKSEVAGNDEPMAFVYPYGNGRVFQTVLGHDAASLRVPQVSQIIRRAVAWTAKREIIDRSSNAATEPLTDGKFGRALNGRHGFLRIAADPRLHQPPLAIECWARIDDSSKFNILASKNPKSSSNHWEFYTFAGSGEVSFYAPGYEPAEIKSGVNVADGKWHHLAVNFQSDAVSLWVDGRKVKTQAIRLIDSGGPQGPLMIGDIASRLFGCDGAVDDLRISSAPRELSHVPESPVQADDHTLGLWRFDRIDSERRITDHSRYQRQSVAIRTAPDLQYLSKWTPKSRRNTRFSYEDEGDDDWMDHRFSQMDTGPFFCSSIKTPGKGMTVKGIAIRLDGEHPAAVLFDTQSMNIRTAWTGAFLTLPPQRFGILHMPEIAGAIQVALGVNGNNWQITQHDRTAVAGTDFRGIIRTRQGIAVSYQVDSASVIEMHRSRSAGDHPAVIFDRHLKIAASSNRLRFPLFEIEDHHHVEMIEDDRKLLVSDDRHAWLFAVTEPCRLVRNQSSVYCELPPHPKDFLRLACSWAKCNRDQVEVIRNEMDRLHVDDVTLDAGTADAPILWGEPIATQGTLAIDDRPLVVDTLTLPFANHFNALLFTSGFDFLPDGRALVCTVHGDVWLVSGIDESLDRLTWQRFATGLYQPLGLKVVDGKAIVMCRDRLTQLHDWNGDGEADYYENFNDDLQITGQSHGYAMSLEADPQGNLYFIKSGGSPPHGGTMLRVSADGKQLDVFATGYRHANGLGVSPNGVVTSADNEGNWIPSTRIDIVRQGGFYGHMPTHRREIAPTIYDGPLCWLPRTLDNSAGGQVWVDNPRWGLLNGKMLHLSFGRCSLIMVLPQRVGDTDQAAAMKLDLPPFSSGAMRGRFNPHDGHLYVVGLDGWQTAAVRDGCFHRIRRTHLPLDLPIEFNVRRNWIEVTFSNPLDSAIATDPDNWQIEQWNYRWSEAYGSDHYRPSQPDQVGHDRLRIRRIDISSDGRTVKLHVDELNPVMQMNVWGRLKTIDGRQLPVDLYNTIHKVAD